MQTNENRKKYVEILRNVCHQKGCEDKLWLLLTIVAINHVCSSLPQTSDSGLSIGRILHKIPSKGCGVFMPANQPWHDDNEVSKWHGQRFDKIPMKADRKLSALVHFGLQVFMSAWLTHYVCTKLIFTFTFQNFNICHLKVQEQHICTCEYIVWINSF